MAIVPPSSRGKVHFDVPFLKDCGKKRKMQRQVMDIQNYELVKLRENQRSQSIKDAMEYLQGFIRTGWPNNIDFIKVQRELTMEQLKFIGTLGQQDGVRECGKLFRAPVIHNEIAYDLWKRLAADNASAMDTPQERYELQLQQSLAASQSSTSEHWETPGSLSRRVTRSQTRQKNQTTPPKQSKRARSAEQLGDQETQFVNLICSSCGSKAKGTVISLKRSKAPVLDIHCEVCGNHTTVSRRYSAPVTKREGKCTACAHTCDSIHDSLGRRPTTSRRLSMPLVKKTLESLGDSLSYGYGGRTDVRRASS
jgi:hypothetical protein